MPYGSRTGTTICSTSRCSTKGTAFTRGEREAFGLTGLLLPAVSSTEQQARRPYDNIMRKSDDFERYIG